MTLFRPVARPPAWLSASSRTRQLLAGKTGRSAHKFRPGCPAHNSPLTGRSATAPFPGNAREAPGTARLPLAASGHAATPRGRPGLCPCLQQSVPGKQQGRCALVRTCPSKRRLAGKRAGQALCGVRQPALNGPVWTSPQGPAEFALAGAPSPLPPPARARAVPALPAAGTASGGMLCTARLLTRPAPP